MANEQEQELKIIITGVGADKVQASLDNLEDTGVKAAFNIKDMFAKITPTLGDIRQIAGEVGSFFREAAEEAREARKQYSMIHDVMGEMEGALQQWSSTSSAAITNTTVDVQKMASELFLLSSRMGATDEQALKLGTDFTDLAGDIAVFKDKNPDEVFRAMKSAIMGESEALKNLGFRLDSTYLKQIALSQGIWDGTGKLEGAAKVMATYAAVMAQAGPVMGATTRAMDEQSTIYLRIAKNIKEFKIVLGDTVAGSENINDTLININSIISDLADPEKISELGRLVDEIGALTKILTGLADVFTAIDSNPIFHKLQGLVDIISSLDSWTRIWEAGLAASVGDIIGMKEALQDSILADVFGSDGLLVTGLEDTEVKLKEVAQIVPVIADDFKEVAENIEEAADPAEKMALMLGEVAKSSENIKKSTKAIAGMAVTADAYFQQVASRLEKQKKLQEEYWEQQEERDEEELESRKEIEGALINLYEAGDAEFQKWLAKQYPGLQKWVDWHKLGANEIERRIMYMYQKIQSAQAGMVASLGGNLASIGGGATEENQAGDGKSRGDGSSSGDEEKKEKTLMPFWGARTVVGMASNENLIRARARANQALGYAKYDLTLADLPERTGRAVAAAITDTIKRPSFQSTLGSVGIGEMG